MCQSPRLDTDVILDVYCCCVVRVEVKFAGKTVAIIVKSSKTLRDALANLLQKHNLQPQDAIITMVRDCAYVSCNAWFPPH